MKLNRGEILNTANGKAIKIIDFLGDGGQGEVYLVDMENHHYALKIYKDDVTSDFWYNLKNNVTKGSPSESFLWPLEIVEVEDKGIYGYLMEVRGKEYKSFVSYLNGKNHFKDVRTMLDWCIKLCCSFKLLHEKGFSYQDLNDGSFFFNPDNGDLLICDNDNVCANKKNLGILGKMRYMAPEIVRGDIDKSTGLQQMPDVHSDRFSLSVILFMTLCMGHPYEGETMKNYDIIDEIAELEMYGKNPIFVYHKLDKSNRPVRGYHHSLIRRWPLIPMYLKEAFHKTFVDGLVDRENSRTTEIEWIKLLSEYRDSLVTCPHCGYQYDYFLDKRNPRTHCPICNQIKPTLSVLTVGKKKIILEPGARLYQPHVDKYSSLYNETLGEVIVNKKNPNLWGIRMINNDEIVLTDSSGNHKIVGTNGVIPIIRNLTIKFNETIEGEIK